MYKFLRIVLMALMSIVISESPAQDVLVNTLRWNVSELTDLLSGSTEEHSCYFITHKKDKISWAQKDGEVLFDLDIKSTTGTWDDVNFPGEIFYKVKLDGCVGSITIKKVNDAYEIILELRGLEDGDIVNRYSVSSFEIL